MSSNGRVELDFGDGTYSFYLGIGEWPELQEKCDAGPYFILNRLHGGRWLVEDISTIIRLGLIGGGLAPPKALKLTRKYVDERPPMENLLLAIAVLRSSLMGVPDEPVGEQEAVNQTENSSMISPMEKSDLPPSTEPEPQPVATPRKKLTK